MAVDFIEKCLTKDPAQRPSVQELLQDPWLQQINSLPTLDKARKEADLFGQFQFMLKTFITTISLKSQDVVQIG